MSDAQSLSEEKLQDVSLEETRPLTSSSDITDHENRTQASPRDEFFSKFEVLQDELQEYMALTKNLKDKRQEEAENDGSSDVSDEASQQARTKLLSIKFKFKDLVRYSKANPVEPSDSEMRQTQMDYFQKKLLKAIDESKKDENEFRHQLRTKSMRQFMIACPDATEEEIGIALDSGNTSHFAESTEDSNETEKTSSVLEQIQERHQEIKRIENSVDELQTLYSQLQALTEQQEPVVEKTDDNIDTTDRNLEEANYDLDTASAYSKEASRRNSYLLVFAISSFLISSGAVGIYLLLTRAQSK